MATKIRNRRGYGMGDGLIDLSPTPIISRRAPSVNDYAEIGTIWIDKVLDDIYVLTSIAAGSATWIGAGGGTGTFTTITASTSVTTPLLTSGADLDVRSTTGIIDIGTPASAYAISIGNSTTTTGVVISSGTDDVQINSTDAVDINATGAFTVDAASISLDATTASNFTVTGAAADLTLDSVGGSVAIDASEAVADAITITASDAAGGIDIAAGTSGVDVNIVDGPFNVISGTGEINIGTDLAAKPINIGNATGATNVQVLSGTGGISINASTGIVTMTPATDTQAAAAVTINANVGYATFTDLTTASAASQVLTITNSVCTAGSAILCTLSNLGANDAQMTVTRVVPASGSFTVTATNNGAASLNGDLILTFWIIS